MTEPRDVPSAELKCPQCGAPVERVAESHADANGPRRVEFRCANEHRISAELHEMMIDDSEPAD